MMEMKVSMSFGGTATATAVVQAPTQPTEEEKWQK